jgi:beta-glucosidase
LLQGIPFYNWLNDDVHDVNRPHATVFPDGCGLGATWNKQAMFNVGYLIGYEARATHNGLVHGGDRGVDENASGMTTYAPNMNLVHDPRWSVSVVRVLVRLAWVQGWVQGLNH